MNAILFSRYGSPAVLTLQTVAIPTPRDDEVLVRVYASSVNPLDWHILRGTPFIARLQYGLIKPKIAKLGADVAGRVEAVGRNVKEFQPGDEVFGEVFENGLGGFAEYVAVREQALALKPANLSFEQAAAVPIAALTALQGLRQGQIQSGQRVMVNGASGGVGTFAVQIAKSFGAEVTGVCSTRNLELVRSIGADHVMDYTKEDFTKGGKSYDLILDAVGNYWLAEYRRAMTPNGICVIVGFTSLLKLFQGLLFGPLVSKRGSQQIGVMATVQTDKNNLPFLKELLEAGKVVPVIDRRYPLAETPEAIGYLEAGHAKGKVIITVAHDDKA